MFPTKPSSQQPTFLYLFRAEDLPLQDTLASKRTGPLKRCLKALQTALSAPSPKQAADHLNIALAIAQKLEASAATSTNTPNHCTGWRLAAQNNHLDIQTLQINHPLQYLVINLVSAYKALLDANQAADFTSQAVRVQRQGLLNCTFFLAEALNLSTEVSQ